MSTGRIGILLTNLGTPDAPTVSAVRAYLNEFLSDPRVIQLPRWFWLPLLRGVILPLRAKRSAKAYQAIWMAEGSPLAVLTAEQAQKLQARLGDGFVVAVGMRYGNPSLQSALRQLAAAQVSEIRVLPLYPQFSKTTVESTLIEIERVRRLSEYAALAAIPYHACPAYYQQAPYIKALADSVRAHWQWRGRAQCLLMSFHGLPKSYGKRGDPYGEQCVATAQALARALNVQWNEFQLCFQSRVGRQAWLEPYTEEVLKELPTRGIRSVQVICPGFAADCLETLEEINIRGREVFLEAGGERFEYIGALNADEAHIEWMAGYVANT